LTREDQPTGGLATAADRTDRLVNPTGRLHPAPVEFDLFTTSEPLPPGWVARCVERGEFFVTREQGQVIGMFRMQWIDKARLWGETPAEAGYLGKLAVCRSAAGRGLGLELLRAAERMVAALGRKWLRLDCWSGNSFLCGYYEKAGFRRCGTGRCLGFEVTLFEKGVG